MAVAMDPKHEAYKQTEAIISDSITPRIQDKVCYKV